MSDDVKVFKDHNTVEYWQEMVAHGEFEIRRLRDRIALLERVAAATNLAAELGYFGDDPTGNRVLQALAAAEREEP